MKNTEVNEWKDKISVLKMKLIKRINPTDINDFNNRFRQFTIDFQCKYNKSQRKHNRFLEENAVWLDSSIAFVPPPTKRGRKQSSFEESSNKTKAKKTKWIRDSTPVSVLTHAQQMSLRADGKVQASKILKEITTTTPTRASKYRKSFKKNTIKQLSPEEALSVIIEAKLSKHSYNVIRRVAPERFPSYKIILDAKQKSYPNRDNIKISETSAQVTLQGLLNNTIERIIKIPTCAEKIVNENISKLTLFSKWGFEDIVCTNTPFVKLMLVMLLFLLRL